LNTNRSFKTRNAVTPLSCNVPQLLRATRNEITLWEQPPRNAFWNHHRRFQDSATRNRLRSRPLRKVTYRQNATLFPCLRGSASFVSATSSPHTGNTLLSQTQSSVPQPAYFSNIKTTRYPTPSHHHPTTNLLPFPSLHHHHSNFPVSTFQNAFHVHHHCSHPRHGRLRPPLLPRQTRRRHPSRNLLRSRLQLQPHPAHHRLCPHRRRLFRHQPHRVRKHGFGNHRPDAVEDFAKGLYT
jgi:hypothetical protein